MKKNTKTNLRYSGALKALALMGAGVSAGFISTEPLFAQDITAGTITGVVVDSNGNPVSDAQVNLSAAERSVVLHSTTDSAGKFRAAQVPFGVYAVEISKAGFDTIKSEGVVAQLGGASYSFTLPANTGSDTIVVTGQRVQTLDFSQAATGLVVSVQDTFDKVPVGRDISSLQLLAPQATAGDTAFDSVTGGKQVALGGGSIAENIYYINGMNVTNFRTFVGGGNVPFEFYDQIQVKTGGYQAEFGRSTGGAVIAVTRSGSNTFKGGADFYWAPSGLRSQAPNTFAQLNKLDKRQDYEGNIWGSGPIIKDRLYFFGFVNPRFQSFTDTNIAGTRTYSSSKEPFYGGKLDFDITDGHRLELTYFNNANSEEGTITSPGTGGSPDLVTPFSVDAGGSNVIGKYTGHITEWFTASFLYGRSKFNRTSASTQPYILDGRSGTIVQVAGHPDAVLDSGNDVRKLYRADFDVTADLLGQHTIRFGIDHEQLSSDTKQTYSAGIAYRYYLSGSSGALTGLIPANTEYVRVRNLNSFGAFESKNTAFYIQDSWDITDRLNLSLGIRNETFKNETASGATFTKMKNQWAPRLGATYDVFGDKRTKISAFFGRYHLPVAANTNIRLGGNELFTQDWYLLTSVDPVTRLPTLGTQVLSEVLSDSAGADPRTLVSANLKPQYQDEFIVGLEHRFEGGWKVNLNGTYRKLKNVLEDVDLNYTIANYCATQNLPGCNSTTTPAGFGSGGYILLNPGRDAIINVDQLGDGNLTQITIPAALLDLPKASRKYWAVEASFDKAWNGKWSLSGSYVWSSLKGNYEGGVKSDNGQDDTGLTQDFDEPGWMDGANGYLPNHRRHTFKLYGAYAVTENLQVGGFARLQSPRKFGCIGVYDEAVGGIGRASTSDASSWYCGGRLVGRGKAFESDWLKQLDLSVSYNIPVAGLGGLQVRADIFNVFNWKSKIDFRELGEDDGGVVDPNYAKVSSYQSPRYVRFGVSMNF